MRHDQRQHVEIRLHHGEIRAVRRLLETHELHHPQSLAKHLTVSVRHKTHVRVCVVRLYAAYCLQSLANITEQMQIQSRKLGVKTARKTSHGRRRKFPLQRIPHPPGFPVVRHHMVHLHEQGRRVRLAKEGHRKLAAHISIKHRRQQAVPRTVIHKNPFRCHFSVPLCTGSSLNARKSCPSGCFRRPSGCVSKVRTPSG